MFEEDSYYESESESFTEADDVLAETDAMESEWYDREPQSIDMASPQDDDVENEEELLKSLGSDEGGSSADDPVRIYLTQMGKIPLLSRAEEVKLARDIDLSRYKFRAKLLECDYVLQHAVRTLSRVQQNELPFDRNVQSKNDSDNLEKQQIRDRLPENLRTLRAMMARNAMDYRTATSRS
ncbi:MAG: RNA polymerase subunit sigma-70, partial [Thermoguttaceae bacterium]|nr:RNA polymerase subunit sigma-70 [Thermoguttaceae bacterium]